MDCIFHFPAGLLHVTQRGACGTCKAAIDAAAAMPSAQGSGRGVEWQEGNLLGSPLASSVCQSKQ